MLVRLATRAAALASALLCVCSNLPAQPNVSDEPEGAPAKAQDRVSPEPQSNVEHPVLQNAPALIWPATAGAPEPGRQIGTTLTIDREGHVTAVAVQPSGNPELDQAAESHAWLLKFSPATLNGQAVPSRIRQLLTFSAGSAEQRGLPSPGGNSNNTDLASRTTERSTGAGTNAGRTKHSEVAHAPSASETEIPPPADSVPHSDAKPLEVVVQGQSQVELLRRSPHAVEVLELSEQRRHASDLGEVLARDTSVGVQRHGGLGSNGRYSLAGLAGDRVRFFLDGVPLELSGFPFGAGNVPLNLLQRVEVYQGVVPIRFGADALGGAVNLVTDEGVRSSRLAASYQLGSFDTHRLTLAGQYFHQDTGLFVRSTAFLDYSANDYPIQVEVADDRGKLAPATVHRFHDGYNAKGATLTVGVADQQWADRFYVRLFGAKNARDVQHNTAMTVPYGEVTYGRDSLGVLASHVLNLSELSRVASSAGYSYRGTTFRDVSRCRYDWFGRCVVELPLSGEIQSIPTDRSLDDHNAYLRAEGTLGLSQDHALKLALAPTLAWRRGKDSRIDAGEYDPNRDKRSVTSFVSGLEYEGATPEQSLVGVAFAKLYAQANQSQERLPNGRLQDRDSSVLRSGGGANLKLSLSDTLYIKTSYEYATRLPSVDELFGDGLLVVENLALTPEQSHNVNLGVYAEKWRLPWCTLNASIEGFARWSEDLMVLLNSGNYAQYDNVLSARALGATSNMGLSSPAERFGLSVRATGQDTRNNSRQGPYALFRGDRLPNLPYLDGGATAFARAHSVATKGDTLELTWQLRYVHRYLRSWEGIGDSDIKLGVPAQTTQGAALTYLARSEKRSLSATLEAQNLTDQKLYDFYGVQRPGRAFFAKFTIENHFDP